MSIILEDITKSYGENVIVNRVSLKVDDGELFVLLGSSGSGKSTILRMIAGLTWPDAGRIQLQGRDVTYLPPQERNTGFVFQNYSVFRHMTVSENVTFGLRIRKYSPVEQKQFVEELLELVGLTGLGSRYPSQLSGGQLQRVALARALAYRPAVLLLDEPFSALDVKIRGQLRQSLKEIQRQLEVTTILVTHDQEEAFELADQIGVLENGNLVETGAPEELYHRPQTEFAATFVGDGNVWVGMVVGGKIKLGSVVLPFPESAPRHEEGAPVRVLFRPEEVLLLQQRSRPQQGVYELGRARIIGNIFSGSQQRINLALEGLKGVRALMPPPTFGQAAIPMNAYIPSESSRKPFLPGEEVWVGLQEYHVLQPMGLKVLIYTDLTSIGQAALEFGHALALAAEGPVTLLTIIEKETAMSSSRAVLEKLRDQRLADLHLLDIRVRKGEVASQILLEAQEGQYEMVILGQHGGPPEPLAWQILMQAELPVLLVRNTRPGIRHVLICTAGGEPGKSDVRFGGRVARRTQSRATLLHVRRPQASTYEIERIKWHMRKGQASLEGLGVPCDIVVQEKTSLLEGILGEAERCDTDLIVIGAPAPRARQQLFWSDLAYQIASSTNRPILIVPMVE